jgi:zinc protease
MLRTLLTAVLVLTTPALATTRKGPPPAATSKDGWPLMPVPGDPKGFIVPKPVALKLQNGTPLWVLPGSRVPVTHIEWNNAAGAMSDPKAKAGLASFATDMMNEGTTSRSAVQLSDQLADLAADFSVSASLDGSSAHLACLDEKLDACLAIAADIMIRPSFPAEDVERVRGDRRNSLIAAKDDPAGVGARVLRRVLWGEQYLGRPSEGRLADLDAITRDELAAWHQDRWAPDAIFVATALPPEQVKAALDRAFQGWVPKAKAETTPIAGPMPVSRDKTEVFWVHRPGMSQSRVLVGHATRGWDAASAPALTLGNLPLGGHFSSRLNLNLREAKGYTYGARTMVLRNKLGGIFEASANVKTATTAPSITEFIKEVQEIVSSRPITAEEFRISRSRVLDGYPARFERAASAISEYSNAHAAGWPLDWPQRLPVLWSKVRQADAQAALKGVVMPNRLVILVVGDWAAVGKDVEALGLGPIIFLDAEGAPTAKP